MPIKIEKAFEKEYMKKGYTKKEADIIFFKWENKNKTKLFGGQYGKETE